MTRRAVLPILLLLAAGATAAPEDGSGDWEATRARFREIAARYQGAGGDAATLRRVKQDLEEFVWEQEENILGGYARLYLGLVSEDLGDRKEALGHLAGVVQYPLPPDDDPERHAPWRDLALQAAYKLGEVANRTEDEALREPALRTLEDLEHRIPGAIELKFGALALLELAKGLATRGDREEALRLAARVGETAKGLEGQDWTEAVAYMAARLTDAVAGADLGRLGVPALLEIAEGRRMAHDFEGAFEVFERAAKTAELEEATVPLAVEAWMKAGECAYRLDRFLAAIAAYDRVLALAEDREVRGNAAYYRYRAATARHAQTRSEEDGVRKLAARKDFIEGFPEHPRARDLAYYAASDLVAEGDGLAAKGRAAEAAARYEEAVATFRKVAPASTLHAKALARCAEALHKMGRHEEAVSAALLAAAQAEEPRGDPEAEANRIHALAIAAYYRAKSHLELGHPVPALAALEGFEERFDREDLAAFVTAALHERLKAACAAGDLRLAEAGLAALRERDPSSARTALAHRDLALLRARTAEEARAAGDVAAFRARLARAVADMEIHLAQFPKPGWEDRKTLGEWLADLDRREEAAAALGKAQAMLEALAAEPGRDFAAERRIREALHEIDRLLRELRTR